MRTDKLSQTLYNALKSAVGASSDEDAIKKIGRMNAERAFESWLVSRGPCSASAAEIISVLDGLRGAAEEKNGVL